MANRRCLLGLSSNPTGNLKVTQFHVEYRFPPTIKHAVILLYKYRQISFQFFSQFLFYNTVIRDFGTKISFQLLNTRYKYVDLLHSIS